MALVLYCATSNPGKLAEFRHAAPPGLEIVAAGPFDCPETGGTFHENAVQKALCYARHLDGLVFADDSGLEVEVLGGEPGIHSARYAGPNATDEDNRHLLLARLGARAERPRARFLCVVALAQSERLLATFEGMAGGEILDAPRGSGGFGYDPLFYYPPLGRTFAELDPEEKFVHSHRGKAFRAMLRWLEEHRAVNSGTTISFIPRTAR